MDNQTNRPWDAVAPTGPIYRVKDAAAYLGISITNYYEKVARGSLPAPLKIGGHASGVPAPWLDSVIAHAAAGVAR